MCPWSGDWILMWDASAAILTGIGVWNLVEVQVGIIAACGPSIRDILGRLSQSVLSLLGMFRVSTKSSSGELPGFVKMPKRASDRRSFGRFRQRGRRSGPRSMSTSWGQWTIR
jgi:hypothetical protein